MVPNSFTLRRLHHCAATFCMIQAKFKPSCHEVSLRSRHVPPTPSKELISIAGDPFVRLHQRGSAYDQAAIGNFTNMFAVSMLIFTPAPTNFGPAQQVHLAQAVGLKR